MAFIVMFTIYSVDKTDKEPNLSLSVAFMISSIYAVIIFGGIPINKRIDTFSKGAGASNLMLMLWIYVLAGAFAASAKSMGAIDATVNMAFYFYRNKCWNCCSISTYCCRNITFYGF